MITDIFKQLKLIRGISVLKAYFGQFIIIVSDKYKHF